MSYFPNEVFMIIRIRSNGHFPTLNAMIYLSACRLESLTGFIFALYVATAVTEPFCFRLYDYFLLLNAVGGKLGDVRDRF